MTEEFSEREEIRRSAQRVISSVAERRTLLERTEKGATARKHLWDAMAELGWLGLTIAEAHGGAGQSFPAAAVLYEELGRVLSPLPLMQLLIGVEAIAGLSDREMCSSLMSRASAGELVLTLLPPGAPPLIAQSIPNGIQVSGAAAGLMCDERSTHLLIGLALNGERRYAMVPLSSVQEVIVSSCPTWDQSRKLCDISLASMAIAAEHVLSKEVNSALEAHFDLALACDSIGGAEAIFADTISYMSTRQQFGRAIASFQALKHRCADHKVMLEAARVVVEDAVLCFDSAVDSSYTVAAAAAKLYATTVYRQIAEDAIQLHGGIGFTWAHDCHLFLKRALLNETLGGSPEAYRDRIAAPLIRRVSSKQIKREPGHKL